MDRKKIYENHIPEKGLTSRMYNEHLKLTKRKQTTQLKKLVKYLNRRFTEEDIQMVNKHIKRSSISSVIREWLMFKIRKKAKKE